VGVGVGVCVGVAVGVCVGVAVGVCVGVAVGVCVGVAVGVWVTVGVVFVDPIAVPASEATLGPSTEGASSIGVDAAAIGPRRSSPTSITDVTDLYLTVPAS
jgi:hypothetical protein